VEKLTRKQLEEAAKCDSRCVLGLGEGTCKNHDIGFKVDDCVKYAAQTALSLMDELEQASKAIEVLQQENKTLQNEKLSADTCFKIVSRENKKLQARWRRGKWID